MRIILPTRWSNQIAQPLEHWVQMPGAVSRSHGRAWNRYLVLVSAPTGQISITLPLNLESKSVSLNVEGCIDAPRKRNASCESPEISSVKRTHRPHWMHRSRSSVTYWLSGNALGRCRFISTKRLVEGP